MMSWLVAESRLPVGSSARIRRRIIDQRTSNGDSLLLSAGELIGLVIEPLLEPDEREDFHGAIVTLLAGEAVVHHGQLDIFQRAEVRESRLNP